MLFHWVLQPIIFWQNSLAGCGTVPVRLLHFNKHFFSEKVQRVQPAGKLFKLLNCCSKTLLLVDLATPVVKCIDSSFLYSYWIASSALLGMFGHLAHSYYKDQLVQYSSVSCKELISLYLLYTHWISLNMHYTIYSLCINMLQLLQTAIQNKHYVTIRWLLVSMRI